MSAERPLPWFALPLAVVTVLMTAFAAGAAWSVLALFTGRTLAPLALAVGAVVGLLLRSQGLGGRWWSGLLAALACAAACVYAAYLIATADVASLLGMPMRSALPRIGPEMALAVAWARASIWQLAWAAVGCIAAGALASRGQAARG